MTSPEKAPSQEGSMDETPTETGEYQEPTDLNLAEALSQEKNSLGRYTMGSGARAAIAAGFIALTAACSEHSTSGYADNDTSQHSGGPTRIETRKFSGYGISTEQSIEVDSDGNVIRVISEKSSYGSGKSSYRSSN